MIQLHRQSTAPPSELLATGDFHDEDDRLTGDPGAWLVLRDSASRRPFIKDQNEKGQT